LLLVTATFYIVTFCAGFDGGQDTAALSSVPAFQTIEFETAFSSDGEDQEALSLGDFCSRDASLLQRCPCSPYRAVLTLSLSCKRQLILRCWSDLSDTFFL